MEWEGGGWEGRGEEGGSGSLAPAASSAAPDPRRLTKIAKAVPSRQLGVSTMATMNVSLPSDMAKFVEDEVEAGGYASSSEVVREALRLLQRDKAREAEKLAILRREINIGLADAEAGRLSRKSVMDIADEVRREHLAE